jgi:hypothetical protein
MEIATRSLEFELAGLRGEAAAMTSTLSKLGAEFGVGSAELTRYAANLVDAGASSSDALRLVAVAGRAAVGASEQMGPILENLITVMRRFDVPGSQLAALMDTLARASQIGRGSVADVTRALAAMGNAIEFSGGDINELIALMTALTERGETFAEAVDTIRTALRAMYPTEMIPGERKPSVDVSSGRMIHEGMMPVLRDMANASEEDLRLIGKRYEGYTALRRLVRSLGDAQRVLNELQQSGGTVAEEYGRSQDMSLQKSRQATKALSGALTSIGGAVAQAFVFASDIAEDMWSTIGKDVEAGVNRLIAALGVGSRGWRGFFEDISDGWNAFLDELETWDISVQEVFLVIHKAAWDLVDGLNNAWVMMIAAFKLAVVGMNRSADDLTAYIGARILDVWEAMKDVGAITAAAWGVLPKGGLERYARGKVSPEDRRKAEAAAYEENVDAAVAASRRVFEKLPRFRQTLTDEDLRGQITNLEDERTRRLKKRASRPPLSLELAGTEEAAKNYGTKIGRNIAGAMMDVAKHKDLYAHLEPTVGRGVGRLTVSLGPEREAWERRAATQRDKTNQLLERLDRSVRESRDTFR